MRVMTDNQKKTLQELLKIAGGDNELVDRAIREAARGKEAAPIGEVIKYILLNRKRAAHKEPA